jgi:caffeoyl-CoA O-methyltransferase
MRPVTLAGIEDYARAHSTIDPTLLESLIAETNAGLPVPTMLSGPVQGRFLQMLIHIQRPRTVVEVGTYSGYAALSMAAALPPDGHLTTCEIDPVHAQVASRYVQNSPYASRITIELGDARDTLARLPGPFDLVFIDADKPSYLEYFEAALSKLSSHGLIVADNTLWNGDVLDPASTDADTVALRGFNDAVVADERVECVLLSVRDGVTLIRHRAAAATAVPPRPETSHDPVPRRQM